MNIQVLVKIYANESESSVAELYLPSSSSDGLIKRTSYLFEYSLTSPGDDRLEQIHNFQCHIRQTHFPDLVDQIGWEVGFDSDHFRCTFRYFEVVVGKEIVLR